jgi:hypothetical protein
MKKRKFDWKTVSFFIISIIVIFGIHYLINHYLIKTNLPSMMVLFLPYIFNLFIIILIFAYIQYIKERKFEKLLKLFIWAPFLDIAINFFIFLISLFFNYENDVTLIFKQGQGIFFVALVVIADWLWWKTINTKRNKNAI